MSKSISHARFYPHPTHGGGGVTWPASLAGPRTSASTSTAPRARRENALFLPPPRRPLPPVQRVQAVVAWGRRQRPRRAYHQGDPGPLLSRQALARRVRATLTCGPGCPVPTRRDGLDGLRGRAQACAVGPGDHMGRAELGCHGGIDTRRAAIGPKDSEVALFYCPRGNAAPSQGPPYFERRSARTTHAEVRLRSPLLPTPGLIVCWLDHCCFDSLGCLMFCPYFRWIFSPKPLVSARFCGALTVGLPPLRSSRLVR